MRIQIYGTGCDKCAKLAANAQIAVQAAGVEAEVEKVDDIAAITAAGVFMTPALSIDGKIVSSGKVLPPEEITKMMGCKDGVQSAAAGGCVCGSRGKSKKALTVLLLALVVFSIAAMIVREVKVPTSQGVEAVAEGVVVVYYFHGNQRCFTCNRIEELTAATLKENFAGELASGSVVMRSVNLDEKTNGHFIEDFQLAARTVVMQKDGAHENFEQVWSLVREPDKLKTYIREGVAAMLAK